MFSFVVCIGLTSEKEEEEDHDGGVAEIEKGGGCSFNLQLGDEVVHAVDEQVEAGKAAGQEAAPPPVVVLYVQKMSRNRGQASKKE